MLPRLGAARAVPIVFGAGVLLRVALVIGYRPAFLGIPDSGTYVDAAHHNLLSDPVHPAGYALFLRVLHWLAGQLVAVTVVQHALGVVAAALLFVLARRAGDRAWVGLVPAAVVLFNGLELWSEHAPLSDPLFTTLVAAALIVAVRARDGRPLTLGLLGLLLAAATLIRTVGLVLVPLVAGWLLVTMPVARARRATGAGVVLVVALAALVGYMTFQQQRTGVFGFTAGDGRITYAVAAPFAECSHFTPPPGTRGLCQSIPPARRQSVNAYLWGFPDHAAALPPGGRGAVSPAWRAYGPMPGGNGPLGAFGRDAIRNQPLDYVSQVLRNFSYFWRAGPGFFLAVAPRPDPDVQRAVVAYYGGSGHVSRSGFGPLAWYARHLEIDGPLVVALLVLSLTAFAVPSSEGRAIAVLCACGGWLLLLGSALVTIDPRYALPALGPLAAAAAIGTRSLVKRGLRLASSRRGRPPDRALPHQRVDLPL
jgi:hypothetical protein